MTGIFREYVEKLAFLGFYLKEGERAYLDVGEIKLKENQKDAHLFLQLGENFEFYSGALYYLRKSYFKDYNENPFFN